jgi:hypothetical protein
MDDTTLLKDSLATVAGIYGGIVLFLIVCVMGDLKFKLLLKAFSMLVYVAQMGLNVYTRSYIGAAFSLLYINPHVVLIMEEIRKGVMD